MDNNKLKQIFIRRLDVEPLLVFSFRVKFFPADPFRLTGNSKIMIYQQLKRDLIHGRLYCSAGEAAALGSLIVQGNLYIFAGSVKWINGLRLQQTLILRAEAVRNMENN